MWHGTHTTGYAFRASSIEGLVMAMSDHVGTDLLRDCVARIRNAKIPHTPESHRTKALQAIDALSAMLPVGEPLQGHQLVTLANLLHMVYSVGKLDGMREMIDTPSEG